MMEDMSVKKATQWDFGKICTPTGASVQCVDNQEGKNGEIVCDLLSFPMKISEDTFEENVQMSVQCMENQEGLHGQLVFEDVSYLINLQPLDDPDTEDDDDDEGIVMNMA